MTLLTWTFVICFVRRDPFELEVFLRGALYFLRGHHPGSAAGRMAFAKAKGPRQRSQKMETAGGKQGSAGNRRDSQLASGKRFSAMPRNKKGGRENGRPFLD